MDKQSILCNFLSLKFKKQNSSGCLIYVEFKLSKFLTYLDLFRRSFTIVLNLLFSRFSITFVNTVRINDKGLMNIIFFDFCHGQILKTV